MLFTRSYPVPDDEVSRLAALRAYGIMDTPPELPLDDVVALARDTFDVEASLISLVDDDRQWFKARAGWSGTETGRDCSFCSYAILSTDVMVVSDATADPRFKANPLVIAAPSIRFYAGAPLRTPAGHAIGTLCLIDSRAREGLSSGDRRQLASLAQFVMTQLQKRVAPKEQRSRQRYGTSLKAVMSAYHIPPTEVQIVNLSQRGALMRLPDIALPKGEEILVSIRTISVVATVAWAQDEMNGITFHKPLSIDELKALIRAKH